MASSAPGRGRALKASTVRPRSEAILALQEAHGEEDETAFVTLLNVVEQACNSFLAHGAYPSTYEQMRAFPVRGRGLLTFAGDDGGTRGQAYRLTYESRGPDGHPAVARAR